MRTRGLRVLLAVAVMLSLVITPAMSFASAPEKAPHATGLSPAANSADEDWWENDDLNQVGWANPLTDYIPWEGDGFYTQAHTIDLANGDFYDVDWYYFDVEDDEIAIDEVRFLIEAVSLDQDVDLCIEVYEDGVAPNDPTADPGLDLDAIAADDDSFWSLNPAAALVPINAGRYWVRVRPYYADGSGGFTGHAGAYTFKIQRTLAERVQGSDRYATAVQVSKRGLVTNPVASQPEVTVLLANGMNYPDALSGAPLATANGYGGSLLLTPKDSLPSTVAAEIRRTGAQKVYVLGGANVVSNNVLSQVASINPGISVERVSGTDRLKTSVAIAREARTEAGSPRRFAFIAYAFNYPDALAATPIAVHNTAPIFLTPTNSLPAETLDAMGDIGVTDIVILGSTTVVSTAVYNQCVTYAGGADHVLRVAGANRYETAKEIALWSSDLKGPGARGDYLVGTPANSAGLGFLSINNLGLASGENFPDALSGGVLCGYTGHPILLTPRDSVTGYIYDVYLTLPAGKTDFFVDAGSPPSIEESLVFGSEAAVGPLPLLIFALMLGY